MKGSKLCKNCGNPSGPRTLICPKCQTPFTKKEKQESSNRAGRQGFRKCPSCDAEIHVRKLRCKCGHKFGEPKKSPIQLSLHFTEIQDEHELSIGKRFYDQKMRVWESHDHQFRIRKCVSFQGVKLDRKYRLMELRNGEWTPASYMNRFKKLAQAVENYVKRKDGTLRVKRVVHHPTAKKTRRKILNLCTK